MRQTSRDKIASWSEESDIAALIMRPSLGTKSLLAVQDVVVEHQSPSAAILASPLNLDLLEFEPALGDQNRVSFLYHVVLCV